MPSAAKQGPWRPIVLDNDRLDLAVARGAAYYGMVRRGQGVRIAAGLARTYYIGVEAATLPASPAPASPGPQSGGVLLLFNRTPCRLSAAGGNRAGARHRA